MVWMDRKVFVEGGCCWEGQADGWMMFDCSGLLMFVLNMF